MKKFILSTLALFLAGSVLTGCGDDKEEEVPVVPEIPAVPDLPRPRSPLPAPSSDH